ncbi:MAG: MmcQ/YjbR family DNA-binding protein [Candidatus Saccharimonadales bacterium]
MTHKQIEDMLLALPGVYLDYPFGEGVGVYKVKEEGRGEKEGKAADKMMAIIDEKSQPVRLSLKCDPGLALLLREKYETVLPGYHLNKKHWNTIICSGQVPDDELRDLARHSYELVK